MASPNVEHLRRKLAVLELELARTRIRVENGKATLMDLEHMLEEEYQLKERLAVAEFRSNS